MQNSICTVLHSIFSLSLLFHPSIHPSIHLSIHPFHSIPFHSIPFHSTKPSAVRPSDRPTVSECTLRHLKQSNHAPLRSPNTSQVVFNNKKHLSHRAPAPSGSPDEVKSTPVPSRIWRSGVDLKYREELLVTGFSCEVVEDPRNSVA